MNFPADIIAHLVFWDNLEGQVDNSDLDMAGNMLHHACMVDSSDIRKRTKLSHMNNMVGLWCQRKGSATSTSPPAHLLRLQAIHQWFHCYVPCHNFMSRVDNVISYRPYFSQDLTDAALLAHMDASHTQDIPWSLCTPPSEIVSAISSKLRRKTYPR